MRIMKRGRIYTVHYGQSISTTNEFIAKTKEYLGPNLDLVIINNSPEFKIVTDDSKFIRIIESDNNLGYFGGIKKGIDEEPIVGMDYIIVCNNDTQILAPDFFTLLEKKIDDYDIIAPSIRTLENIEQNPHRETRIKLSKKCYYRLYFFNYYFAIVLSKLVGFKKRKVRRNLLPSQIERKIFSPHGAFLIFNRSYFDKGGVIDNGYFLYGEEDSIAAIAILKNMSIGFIPSLKILHQESITTGKKLSKKKYQFQKKAHKYIRHNYPHLFY